MDLVFYSGRVGKLYDYFIVKVIRTKIMTANRLKSLLVGLIVFSALVMVPHIYAQEPVTIQTDKVHYEKDEPIIFSGQIATVVDDEPVLLHIFNSDSFERTSDPHGYIITLDQINIGQAGSFSTTFFTNNTSLLMPAGEYSVLASYRDYRSISNFNIFDFELSQLSKLEICHLTSDPSLIQTDKDSYVEGDTIKISGKVDTCHDGPISLRLKGIEQFEINVGQDGTFNHTITPDSEWSSSNYQIDSRIGPHALQDIYFKYTSITNVPDTVLDSNYHNSIPYELTGATLVWYDYLHSGSPYNAGPVLLIELDYADGGQLVITLPRDDIDALTKDGKDDEFMVYVDNKRAEYTEIESSADNRTLQIPFPACASMIEIKGTSTEHYNVFEPDSQFDVGDFTIQTDYHYYVEGDSIVISGQIPHTEPDDGKIWLSFDGASGIIPSVYNEIDVAQDGTFTHTIDTLVLNGTYIDLPSSNRDRNFGHYVNINFHHYDNVRVHAHYTKSDTTYSSGTEFILLGKLDVNTVDDLAVKGGSCHHDFDMAYDITGGIVGDVAMDWNGNALVIPLIYATGGHISLIPQPDIIGAINPDGNNVPFIVTVDGIQVDYEEILTINAINTDHLSTIEQSLLPKDFRRITIPFEKGDSEIRVIGTYSVANGKEPTITYSVDQYYFLSGDDVVVRGYVDPVVPDAPVYVNLGFIKKQSSVGSDGSFKTVFTENDIKELKNILNNLSLHWPYDSYPTDVYYVSVDYGSVNYLEPQKIYYVTDIKTPPSKSMPSNSINGQTDLSDQTGLADRVGNLEGKVEDIANDVQQLQDNDENLAKQVEGLQAMLDALDKQVQAILKSLGL